MDRLHGPANPATQRGLAVGEQTMNATLQRRLEELEGLVQCRTSGRIRDLRIEAFSDRVVISGRTSTYYAKQLAQHAAMEFSGLGQLRNEIEVF
jgi:hypothetical protein